MQMAFHELFFFGSLFCSYTHQKNLKSAPDISPVKEGRVSDATVSVYRCF